jgi:heterodisulfide reductase subunit A-like polyferredoxin
MVLELGQKKIGGQEKVGDQKKIGAVMVVGGGVAGVQSALDLADSGYKVYLVERGLSIGGVMAQLDKTFPTNDCSMCILAPKLVDTGRHQNIEIITNAEIQQVEGEAGDFRVTVLKHSRYVDETKCTGCGDCEKQCPVEVPNEFEQGLSKRKAIYKPFAQAIPNRYSIDKRGKSPCKLVCPLEQNAQGYIALIKDKKYREAFNLIRKNNPLPAICGRVCAHPCEEACKRGEIDQPLSIAALKRFVADYAHSHNMQATLEMQAPLEVSEKRMEKVEGAASLAPVELEKCTETEKRTEKVAIIGAGPAGLVAAHDLALKGYPVTIYEALPVAGGMLAVGIPEYRLPRDVLQSQIDDIKALGVEIKLNSPLGTSGPSGPSGPSNPDLCSDSDILTCDDLKAKGYKAKGYSAVLLATGAHKSLKLDVPGEEQKGVIHCTDFLREVNLGKKVEVGQRVAVIGGGNTAVDAARTAWRLGASEVTIIYRRTRLEMPALEDEIIAAEFEGVKIVYLTAPVEVIGEPVEIVGEPTEVIGGNDGSTSNPGRTGSRVTGLKCVRMELGEPDSRGRRRPVPIPGSEFIMPMDTVIPALSQAPDLSFLPDNTDLKIGSHGSLEVDPVTCATNLEGIFAAGEVVTGPGIAVEAMAKGREAAISIDRFLNGQDMQEGRDKEAKVKADPDIDRWDVEIRSRAHMPMLSLDERRGNFREVDLGLTEEMALEEARRCLNCGVCSECMECVANCKAGAVNHDLTDQLVKLEVGSVILAPGYEEFDATMKTNLGYGRFPNVVASIEFERILSASGPYKGHIVRPSDHREPKRIAFIQCVGSRDTSCDNEYCSSVCCMYSIKEAVIAREHVRSIEPTIFYNDMRAYGKDFDKYVNRAEKEYGVRFIKSLVARVEENPETNDLALNYIREDGRLINEQFDLVVLAVGFEPPQSVRNMAGRLNVALNKYGFCQTQTLSPLKTSRPGIFVCGAFVSPKDIPETVMQASGAAGEASALLSSARNTLVTAKTYPPERDVAGEPPRIGVFVCHCGINIGGFVNVPDVREYALTLPFVYYAADNLYTCSEDTQQKMVEIIKEYRLNRVIVASCSPRTHEPLFQATIREAGLNPYLFEMANIRDQCSWVHMFEKEKATAKAKDLVRMAVYKAALIEPLNRLSLPVNSAAVVIGGGLAGMTAALSLADQGFDVHLVEKDSQLGGVARKIYFTPGEKDFPAFLQKTIDQVNNHPMIQVNLDSEVSEVTGFVGNFSSSIQSRARKTCVDHGAIIVATGALEYSPNEYLYGENPQIVTAHDLESLIANEAPLVMNSRNVVMIQCVGSREEGRMYCSRVCCTQSIKNALALKKINPKANVYILYRDIRTYGFKEEYYRKARAEGVVFIRYDLAGKPLVSSESTGNGKRNILIKTKDPILNRQIVLQADLLALAPAILAPKSNKDLARMLKVPVNEDGFFLEAHMKLRPVDFATDGIFVCGLAHAPKSMDESIAQAKAAAARASVVLSKAAIETQGQTAKVDKKRCSGCGLCELVCAYKAIELDVKEGCAKVNEALCKGCGACAATCRCGALDVKGFTNQQIFQMMEAL